MGRFLFKSLLLILLSALAAAALLAYRAPDLSGIKTSAKTGGSASEDIQSLIEQAGIKQSAALEISESQLNAHLAARLAASQAAGSARLANFQRVLIDLEPGAARVYFCWEARGLPLVAMVRLGIQRQGEVFEVVVLDGAYGSLAVPRGMLTPLIPAMTALAKAAEPEIKALFTMPKIRLGQDKLLLDPRF